MSNFAILRIQKLKHGSSVRRSLQHSFREKDTPNADPERTPDNSHYGAQSADEALAKFNARLPEKVRKNGVLCVEYLVTGSPEAINGKSRQQQDAYFADALKWLEAKHGKENVIYAGIHRDETTPHMYAYAVPIDERGRLNCRSFLGEQNALGKMQTNFAEQVGQKHGLERGVERSSARHTSIREYYATVQAATPKTPSVDVPEAGIRDRLNPDEYGQRVAKSVLAQIAPELNTLRAKAQQAETAEKKARELATAAAVAQAMEKQTARQLAELRQAQKTMLELIGRGGRELEIVQQRIRENLAAQKEREHPSAAKSRDDGLSR